MESRPVTPYLLPDWEPNQLPLADEAAYWRQFPSDLAAFRELARGSGISFYCAVRQNTMRFGNEWQKHLDELRALLPSPPKGYFWVVVTGGLIDARYQRFQLWHHDFGYGPTSE